MLNGLASSNVTNPPPMNPVVRTGADAVVLRGLVHDVHERHAAFGAETLGLRRSRGKKAGGKRQILRASRLI